MVRFNPLARIRRKGYRSEQMATVLLKLREGQLGRDATADVVERALKGEKLECEDGKIEPEHILRDATLSGHLGGRGLVRAARALLDKHGRLPPMLGLLRALSLDPGLAREAAARGTQIELLEEAIDRIGPSEVAEGAVAGLLGGSGDGSRIDLQSAEHYAERCRSAVIAEMVFSAPDTPESVRERLVGSVGWRSIDPSRRLQVLGRADDPDVLFQVLDEEAGGRIAGDPRGAANLMDAAIRAYRASEDEDVRDRILHRIAELGRDADLDGSDPTSRRMLFLVEHVDDAQGPVREALLRALAENPTMDPGVLADLAASHPAVDVRAAVLGSGRVERERALEIARRELDRLEGVVRSGTGGGALAERIRGEEQEAASGVLARMATEGLLDAETRGRAARLAARTRDARLAGYLYHQSDLPEDLRLQLFRTARQATRDPGDGFVPGARSGREVEAEGITWGLPADVLPDALEGDDQKIAEAVMVRWYRCLRTQDPTLAPEKETFQGLIPASVRREVLASPKGTRLLEMDEGSIARTALREATRALGALRDHEGSGSGHLHQHAMDALRAVERLPPEAFGRPGPDNDLHERAQAAAEAIRRQVQERAPVSQAVS